VFGAATQLPLAVAVVEGLLYFLAVVLAIALPYWVLYRVFRKQPRDGE